MSSHEHVTGAHESEYSRLCRTIISLVDSELQHGFGEIKLLFEIGNGRRRHVIVQHGHSYKFIIPDNQIPD